jgi:hypothetical protein
LPDGIFSNQKSKFVDILKSLGIENVGIVNGHLEYLTSIWNILGTFGKFVVIWYIIPRFGMLYQEKSGNPGLALLRD